MFDLQIDRDEVARYLGFGQTPLDQQTSADMDWVVEELRRVATPRYTHQIFDLSRGEGLSLAGTNLELEGADIASLLSDCQRCILLAVTLGQGVDGLIRRLQITDLNRSVVTDMCASSMVEHLCNQLDDTLRSQWREREMFLTDRFSPGYGDLPLAIQPRLCQVLSTQKTMGLAVTGAGIMIPRKSITAVIGISHQKQKSTIRGCNHCDLAPDCPYRKGGKHCAP